jgi:DNA-binding NarL/FixJ family response regulator
MNDRVPVATPEEQIMSSVAKLAAAFAPATERPRPANAKFSEPTESPLLRWDARSGRREPPVADAGSTLTAREHDILSMMSRGYSNKLIARALEISPETVKSHAKHIFSKLDVDTRTEAVFRAGLLGLL